MPESAPVPIVPAVWADFYAETRIPAALRVGDTLRVTGHTGETGEGVFSSNPETQIRQVFHNIALTLGEAGARLVQRRGDEFVPRRTRGTVRSPSQGCR